eukprot:TRINITY_DN4017_c0_g1_i1.p1 TRINITY_DN4017_c0_g1~~TRINITY_DN4017_c0_g1_i1.p1  ORF type:complete len:262 (-),score=26.73 TRINITY_DN4017_c0_g1_i1:36-821(-)
MEFIQNFRITKETPLIDPIYPIAGSILYVATIYGLQALMKGREKEVPLIKNLSLLHNVNLIVLSVSMFFGMIASAYGRYQSFGAFRGLVCPSDTTDPEPLQGPFGFVIYVFYLSKYYELVDTLILVLRKKEVIFLHIYHHFIMILVTWSWVADQWVAGAWWCVVVNSLVHTFMYYYYLMTALGKRISWKSLMTGGQIVQLWSGFFLVSYWFWVRSSYGCERGLLAGVLSHGVNFTLIYQFMKFYVKLYLTGSKKTETRKSK